MNTQWSQPLLKINPVLVSENFCGCHQCRLPAIGYGLYGCQSGHHRLARTHITLYQAQHGNRGANIRTNFLCDSLLGRGQGEG